MLWPSSAQWTWFLEKLIGSRNATACQNPRHGCRKHRMILRKETVVLSIFHRIASNHWTFVVQ